MGRQPLIHGIDVVVVRSSQSVDLVEREMLAVPLMEGVADKTSVSMALKHVIRVLT